MNDVRGKIVGIGTYIPKKVVTNDDLAKRLDTSDQWIRERTGIRERHIAADDEQTSDMAVAATNAALSQAGLTANDLDLIIVATSSGDYITPPVSCQVQDKLGAKKTGSLTLVLGCAGFVAAYITAEQFIRSGTCKTVAVIGVELISRFINWDDRSTCPLFGDGAGAVILKATSEAGGILGSVIGSDGSGAELLVVPSGGSAMPPSLETIEKKLHTVIMNGNEVFKFATRIFGSALNECLVKANLTTDDLDLFIPHQANYRIIESAARHVGIPMSKVFVNVERYGNTSAASVPIALAEAYDQGRVKDGGIIAMVAFGAGLSWAGAVMKW